MSASRWCPSPVSTSRFPPPTAIPDHKENDMSTTVTTAKPAANKRVPMSPLRKSSLSAGVFYLISFVSIPTLFLYASAKDANYIVGGGAEAQVMIGGILEVIVALAGIGSAVALFPVIKRQNEGVALGLVATRTLEAGTILSGV